MRASELEEINFEDEDEDDDDEDEVRPSQVAVQLQQPAVVKGQGYPRDSIA